MALNKALKLVDLVETGRIPIKVLVREYPTGKEIYIGRYNGWSWIVWNPDTFPTTQIAQTEIDRVCRENPIYIDASKL